MGISAAIGISAIIGAGSAAYQGEQQKKLAKKDADRRKAEADAAKAESDRIASETRPDEIGLEETKFGVDKANKTGGSTSDFLVPKTSALGGTGRSGLGFTI
jgi:hypothetical protein